jgi:nitrate/TMAO reductase-like tetraheme cytochrome c subunit
MATVAVIGALILLISGEKYFSSTGFCISCHAMSYPYEALKKSYHYGRLGINPECRDCHFPPQFYFKIKTHAFNGIKDIISNFRYDLMTKEAFDKHREDFAARARAELKAWGSSPCRTCHKDPSPSSEFGRVAHESARNNGKMTCVDCHQNLVH